MSNNEGKYERLLSIQQVARILSVGESTVRDWIKDGRLPAVALPRDQQKRVYYRIRKSTVDQIIRAGEVFPKLEEQVIEGSREE